MKMKTTKIIINVAYLTLLNNLYAMEHLVLVERDGRTSEGYSAEALALQELPNNAGMFLSGMDPNNDEADFANLAGGEKKNTQPIKQPVLEQSETSLKLVAKWHGIRIDGRKRVKKTKQYPYSCFVNLDLYFDQSGASGSGFMIGKQHLLTAAHCVFSCPHDHDDPKCGGNKCKDRTFAKHVVAHCGLNGKTKKPFGVAQAVRIFVPQQYRDSSDSEFDFALLILDKPIGIRTGWIGCLYGNDEYITDKTIAVTGYPGDKPLLPLSQRCKKMYTMEHKVVGLQNERLTYILDTYSGQSGSPIWHLLNLADRNLPFALGVHTNGTASYNSGIRFTQNKINALLSLRNLYGEKDNAPKQSGLITTEDDLLFGVLVPQDIKRAIAGLQANTNEAGESDRIHAHRRLGEIYFFGYGLPQNRAFAREQFNKVVMSTKGDKEDQAWSFYWLAVSSFEDRDYGTARACLDNAKKLDCKKVTAQAEFLLARLDFDGLGLGAADARAGSKSRAVLSLVALGQNEDCINYLSSADKITLQKYLGHVYFEGLAKEGRNFDLARSLFEYVLNKSDNKTEVAEVEMVLSKIKKMQKTI